MAMETLTCDTCEQQWERERKRGRKPKQCPECKHGGKSDQGAPKSLTEENELIFKSDSEPADEYFGRQVTDANGNRDISTLNYPEIEIPDEATETKPVQWLRRYDQIIVDGVLFKAGDKVKILKDNARGTYTVKDFSIHEKGYMYFALVGVSGTYAGKWRMIDPQRVSKR